MSRYFVNIIFISLMGHITVFSIFSFSFGDRIPKTDYANISFLGQILRSSDLSRTFKVRDLNNQYFSPLLYNRIKGLNKKIDMPTFNRAVKGYTIVSEKHFKPSVTLASGEEKIIFMPEAKPISFVGERREPIIMFYPHLPQHFLLYFKDRQAVHIELMFNIISDNRMNYVAIKRKVSSGNLEVDLLSMRYISHYLYIRQAGFSNNDWQTVKIDLSANND